MLLQNPKMHLVHVRLVRNNTSWHALCFNRSILDVNGLNLIIMTQTRHVLIEHENMATPQRNSYEI